MKNTLLILFLMWPILTFAQFINHDYFDMHFYYGYNARAKSIDMKADHFLDAGPGKLYGGQFSITKQKDNGLLLIGAAVGIVYHNLKYDNLIEEFSQSFDYFLTDDITFFYGKCDFAYLLKKSFVKEKADFFYGIGAAISVIPGDSSGQYYEYDELTDQFRVYWQFWTKRNSPIVYPSVFAMAKFNRFFTSQHFFSISTTYEIAPFQTTIKGYDIFSKEGNESGIFTQRYANLRIGIGVGIKM